MLGFSGYRSLGCSKEENDAFSAEKNFLVRDKMAKLPTCHNDSYGYCLCPIDIGYKLSLARTLGVGFGYAEGSSFLATELALWRVVHYVS